MWTLRFREFHFLPTKAVCGRVGTHTPCSMALKPMFLLHTWLQRQRSWGGGAENITVRSTDPMKQPTLDFIPLQALCAPVEPAWLLQSGSWNKALSQSHLPRLGTQMFTRKWNSPKMVSSKLILRFASKGHCVWATYRWLVYSVRKGFLGGVEQPRDPSKAH